MPKRSNPSRPSEEQTFIYNHESSAPFPPTVMGLGLWPVDIMEIHGQFDLAQSAGKISRYRKYATIERHDHTIRIRRDGTTYTIKVKPTRKAKA